MAETKEPTVRIFEKKTRDGETLTRKVTSESAAVSARFDGYVEKGTGGKKAGGAGTGPAANNAG